MPGMLRVYVHSMLIRIFYYASMLLHQIESANLLNSFTKIAPCFIEMIVISLERSKLVHFHRLSRIADSG